MANSTYRAVVDRILMHAGQSPTPDASTFNDNTKLEKPALQAKLFVDKTNRALVRTTRPHFQLREYSISVTSASNKYELNSAISPENLLEDSWYISTTGKGGQLTFLEYRTWKHMFPEGETNKGRPSRWILLPNEGDGKHYIGFSPPPDGNYSIKYSGFLDPVVLTTDTDVIVWPTKYEDILWDYGQMWLESALSEGKMGDIGQFVESALSELKQLTTGVTDSIPKVDLGISFNSSPRRGHRTARSPN